MERIHVIKKEEARAEWIRIVCRTRVKDADLERQFGANTFHLCEIHFDLDDIDVFPKRKVLRTGSIPTRNLPKKSFDAGENFKERRVVERKIQDPLLKPIYESFETVEKSIGKMKLFPWRTEVEKDMINLFLDDTEMYVPRLSVTVSNKESLDTKCYYFGWRIPSFPNLDIQSNSVRQILNFLETSCICCGIPCNWCKDTILHAVPKRPVLNTNSDPFESSQIFRSKDCSVILLPNAENGRCPSCNLKLKARANQPKKTVPAKDKAPLSACSQSKLVATVKASRLKCRDLENQDMKIKQEIYSNGLDVSDNLHKDITSIVGNSKLNATPLMLRLSTVSAKGRRYHPQFIRFCLSLQAKSSSAYDELSEVLVLPSQRCLRNYKHTFKARPGIVKENVNKLASLTSDFGGIQQYIGIIFDEMKIRNDLVFDKMSGQLIGYVDLGDPVIDYVSFEDNTQFAQYALVFMIRGLCTSLKAVFSYHFTGSSGSTAFQLWPLFWDAIFTLELVLNLKVVFVVCDGASQNRKFAMLNQNLQAFPATGSNTEKETLCHFTVNLADTNRKIFFISDTPHLIKTTRNCLILWIL